MTYLLLGLFAVANTPDVTGYYVLTNGQPGTRVPQRVYDHPVVTGVVLRAGWNELNPRPGVYDWSRWDNEIARAKAAKKKISLQVFTGPRTPDWVVGERFRFTEARKPPGVFAMPVVWDSQFLAQWFEFVQAFGKKYNSDPDVTLIHISGPTRFSVEFHLPRELQSVAGYSPDKVIDAWKQCIEKFDRAFPNKVLSLNVSNVFSGKDTVRDGVAALGVSMLGERIALQHNALAAKTTAANNVHRLLEEYGRKGTRIGFEMLSGSHEFRFGGSFARGVEIGRAAGATWLQVYQKDLAQLPPW